MIRLAFGAFWSFAACEGGSRGVSCNDCHCDLLVRAVSEQKDPSSQATVIVIAPIVTWLGHFPHHLQQFVFWCMLSIESFVR